MKRLMLLGTCCIYLAHAYPQNLHFTIEDLWTTFIFRSKGINDIRSMNDGKHFTVLDENNILKYSYETGEITDTLVKGNLLLDESGKEINIMEYEFNSDETMLLLGTNLRNIYRHSSSGFFYIYEMSTRNLSPLAHNERGRQRLAEFSPDGKNVAFVRNNNLYYKNLETGKEHPVTNDGETNFIINGTCDWVYEEEFGFTKGFYWSPSGRYLAYYRFDESRVKEFTLTYHGALYPKEVKYKYPKAGEDNSFVTIHTYDLSQGIHTLVNTGTETDQYIPRIKWTSSDQSLAFLRLNRLQNHLEILLADPASGSSNLVYEESNKYYIDIDDNIFFLKDKLVLTSEKSGYNHIYSIDLKNRKEFRITAGNFDVIEIIGIDEKNQICYYSASKTTPYNTEIYFVKLDGKRDTRLTQRIGSNSATFSRTFDYYIHQWSDANTPPRYSIVNKIGKEMVVLEANDTLINKLSQYAVPDIDFGTFVTEDNIMLYYWMMKPVDFDPQKVYPMLMYVYGGPGSQTVENSWSYQNLWFRHLTQLGYIVVSVDNRGTSHRGEEFKKCTYLNLGKLETLDQIEAAKYFGSLSYIDKERIGIWGWSYGGYMSTLCLTKGADYFKTGIAVAPVTNWRYYDNIYTERFMRTPAENGENYDNNAPINHINKLKGNYLLIHGLTDDNVHTQQAFDLVTALVAADKQFQMFIYPNKNHGISGGNTRNHLYKMMTDFIKENL